MPHSHVPETRRHEIGPGRQRGRPHCLRRNYKVTLVDRRAGRRAGKTDFKGFSSTHTSGRGINPNPRHRTEHCFSFSESSNAIPPRAAEQEHRAVGGGDEAAQSIRGCAPATVGGYYPFLALVGGAPVGAVLEKLFESKDRARLRPKRVCTAFSLKPRPPPVHRRPSKMTGRAESQPG